MKCSFEDYFKLYKGHLVCLLLNCPFQVVQGSLGWTCVGLFISSLQGSMYVVCVVLLFQGFYIFKDHYLCIVCIVSIIAIQGQTKRPLETWNGQFNTRQRNWPLKIWKWQFNTRQAKWFLKAWNGHFNTRQRNWPLKWQFNTRQIKWSWKQSDLTKWLEMDSFTEDK